ncbi:MAG: hypothetical protein ABMB14_07185 [Myxococcota bacterium]
MNRTGWWVALGVVGCVTTPGSPVGSSGPGPGASGSVTSPSTSVTTGAPWEGAPVGLPQLLKLDGREALLSNGLGAVDPDQGTIAIELSTTDMGDCATIDDEHWYGVSITVTDPSRVVLGEPIDLADPAAPVAVVPWVSCMFCSGDDQPAAYTLTGSLVFDTLSPNDATGAVNLYLVGDVPLFDAVSGYAYAADSLEIQWTFAAPFDEPGCYE